MEILRKLDLFINESASVADIEDYIMGELSGRSMSKKEIFNMAVASVEAKKYEFEQAFKSLVADGDLEKKGNKYNIGHTVNYKTHQYKKLNSGKLVSTECPCQLNGDSLYSDGIIWRYIGEGVNKTSNIHNISVFDVKLDDGRKIVRTINADSNDYGEYPGTENMSVLDSVYTEGYRLNITKGAVGVWKTIPAKNQDILDILLVLIILLITIISYYFLTNKKFEKIIHK